MKTVGLFLVFLFSSLCAAEELSVAAASDLNFALQEIAKKYQQTTGNTLKLSFGSSGNFFAQIQNGAPFDLYFSADVDFPKKLESTGFAEPGTLYRYAVGKLALWVPNGSKLDLNRGIQVLLDPSIKRIAIANPKHAPYGRAAEAAMRKAGIYDKVSAKLVVGENISQAAQFVETGNADIGLVALSLVSALTMQGRGRYIAVPSDLYPALEQGAIVVRSSNKKSVARDFLQFLKKPEAQAIFRKYGFQSPDVK
ncbi:MAG TPA: molybdate ABC transporter substrate-binding protein [Terriglobales bacterium]|nr:molybdate ABC transporter substrate-binding protein [Terriglobales bacterium]